jgi:threonine aldolase
LAAALASAVAGLTAPDEVDTNIVVLDLRATPYTGAELAALCRAEGLLVSVVGPRRVRLLTHLDVDDAGIAFATDVLQRLLG